MSFQSVTFHNSRLPSKTCLALRLLARENPLLMGVLESIWGFLSVVVIAFITQQIITSFEKRKKIEETKLTLYISWMPFFAQCYANAIAPDGKSYDRNEFIKKSIEILGTLQIMGPSEALDAYQEFSQLAEKAFKNDPSFDQKTFHHSFSRLNYCLCCEIHGEPQEVEKHDV